MRNSQLVEVTTIHEMLWSQIKGYKSLQLIDIHKINLFEKIDDLLIKKEEFRHKPKLLPCFEEENNFELLLTDKARDKYYEIITKYPSATEFTKEYLNVFEQDHPYLNSVLDRGFGNFKEFITICFNIYRYQKAIIRIDNPDERKKIKVEYDANTNQDRLASMRFSHDTLLEYSKSLFDKYPVLRQIIIDKYPYLFVDEYQDTNPLVISIIDLLYKQAQNHKPAEKEMAWMVGYFGDHKQHIYGDSGIGSALLQRQKKQIQLKTIDKTFNRRSHQQIIDLINRTRSESDFIQEPINSENNKGIVQFFKLSELSKENEPEKYVPEIIGKFRENLKLERQPIDCLVALNQTIADLSGFGNILGELSNLNFIYWNNINTQFLSRDLSKLHPVVLTIYHTMQFYCLMSSNNRIGTYADLLGDSLKNITIEAAEKFYHHLKFNSDIQTLSEFIKYISEKMGSFDDKTLVSLVIKKHFPGIKELNKKTFDNQFSSLLVDLANKELDFDSLLDLSMESWINWVNYIDEVQNDVIYHTFHGTKGAEYENVIILLGNDFGARQGRNKFKNYFMRLNNTEVDEEFINTQNLLYVAFSRAIKNLWVVYVDPIEDSDLQKGIDFIFEQNKDNSTQTP